MIKITECPRDAMQGVKEFIPTDVKIRYLNLLLQVGFDRLDFGSFVSPKYTPQMQDTPLVVESLETEKSDTKLLAIIANLRGAKDAIKFDQISVLGFPFSISETFQLRNTNSTREESLKTVEDISSLCLKNNKIPLVYLSMAFGNPYGDEWNLDLLANYTEKLEKLGIKEIMISDTTGEANSSAIKSILPFLTTLYPTLTFGLHLHSKKEDAEQKLASAINSGCTRFDTALRGFGGCPMAKDDLVGNIATESLIQLLIKDNLPNSINKEALEEALHYSHTVFAI